MSGRSGSRGLVVAGLLALTASACAATTASERRTTTVTATPATSTAQEPVHIVVRGLAPRQLVSLSLRSIDATGVPWVSSAAFRATRAGVVDVDRVAPVAGPYEGVWGMGLLAMLTATKRDPAGAYFWNRTKPERFTVTVRSHGRRLAATAFRRHFLSQPVRHEHLALGDNGFYGDYFAPTASDNRRAILAIGGSEGGNFANLLASEALAARGYPVLDIAYFKEPGLPQTLSQIPIEYFAHALEWLRVQPEVDSDQVITLGESRGSEAALLLGAYYPDLVHGVVALVPSSVALCSYPTCDGPAWTLDGAAIPYTRQLATPHPSDDPAAAIPVERIHGPVLLECAGSDRVWPSCPYASAIMERLDAKHDRYPHSLYPAPGAGHFIGSLVPYEPLSTGATPVDEIAREKFWPHLLAFLARP